MPERIQLKRTKGWRMPENTVKVDRSTAFGNPFSVKDAAAAGLIGYTSAHAVKDFREWFEAKGETANWYGTPSRIAFHNMFRRIVELRGKNLACWCKPGDPCHADVLLELANADDEHKSA